MFDRAINAIGDFFYGKKQQRIPADYIPEQLELPPVVMPPQLQQPDDPGAAFAPRPKPRTDLGVLPVQAGQLTVAAPLGIDGEVSFRLTNGDWTPWRPAKGTAANSVSAIGVRWRVRGAA